MATEVIYTDGACSGNGTARSKGGFGIFISKSAILPRPLKLNKKGETMKHNDETFYVTNIRMEGLAIISTLAIYADMITNEYPSNMHQVMEKINNISSLDMEDIKTKYGPNELKLTISSKPISIEIVTDSLFWINVIESWMPSWIRKGILNEKKNPDLLLMLCYYIELFKQNCVQIQFTHVRSHQKGKRTAHADGNDIADQLATSSVTNPTNKFYMA